MAARMRSNFMTEQEFKDYTKQITLRVVKLVEELPNIRKAQIIGAQLLQSTAAIGANYRAACRGKSSADLINYLTKVEHEADQSIYWLEVMSDSKLISDTEFSELNADLDEIVEMTNLAIRSLRPK